MPIMSRYVLVEIDDASPPIREQYEAFLRASGGMSEILAFSCPGALMLTGLTNRERV